MAQKPLLWVEAGAHAVRNRSKCGGVEWAGVGVAWRLGVCVVFGAFWAVWRRQLSLYALMKGFAVFILSCALGAVQLICALCLIKDICLPFDDDVIYVQYDSSTPLRFSAPA